MSLLGYLDLPSGLSGDMMLSCLVDAGWPLERLRATIESLSLPASRWAINAEEVRKGALRAMRVDVLAEEDSERRGLRQIREIIEKSSLPKPVRQRAIAVFTRLAEAEGKVHGIEAEAVHFHEVGAVDAIIDIVGSVAGLHDLGIEQLYASAAPLGEGWAQTAHGAVPLPAPATLELLAAVHAPSRPAPGPGELLTPTGAALLAELARFEQPWIQLHRVGTGAGTKDFAWPNIARLWIGEPGAGVGLVQLETNIDDMNPQFYPAITQRLLAAGARDVWLTPVQMKKGRPGVILSVLGPAASEDALAELILRETTTLGVRVHSIHHRHEAERQVQTVNTAFGEVRVKIKLIGGVPASAMPEYEDCRALAEKAEVSVAEVHAAAQAAAQALLVELRPRST